MCSSSAGGHPGTGFAPMRAFCWERLAMKQAGIGLGEAALFNGIRSSRLDYLHKLETTAHHCPDLWG